MKPDDPELFWTPELRLKLIAKAVKLMPEEPSYNIHRIDILAIMPAYFLETNRLNFADLLKDN